MLTGLLLASIPGVPAPAQHQQNPAPIIANATIANAASAPKEQAKSYPYASLQLGIGIPQNYNGDINPINTSTTLDLGTGFNGEAAIGYKFNDFRTDLSVGYGNFPVINQKYSTPGLGSATFGGQGAVNLWTVMANAYYDIPIRTANQDLSRWSPYIGAGIGYANIGTPACAASDCYSAGNAGAFAWQAKAGVSYRATERGFAFLEGGYLGTAGTTTVDDASFNNFGTWRINLGWRQGFGGAPSSRKVVQAAQESAPEPAVAPQPEVAPAPQQPIRGLW